MSDLDVRMRKEVSLGSELEEGVASKILRETQMIGSGVGGAFVDTANNLDEKAPDLALDDEFLLQRSSRALTHPAFKSSWNPSKKCPA